ncbi:MAG: serine O-acetyltransferase EpsC [Candidatus Limivivens sp.]|nr:serine O-acetyltransferase EpsC [Candidatus Limivivens sp.]
MSKHPEEQMQELVNSLLESYEQYPIISNVDSCSRINRDVILQILEQLRYIVFPGYFEMRNLKSESLSYHIGEILESIQYNLTKQVARALYHDPEHAPGCWENGREESAEIVRKFLGTLPRVREVLATDVQAGYDGDPAAFNTDEVILSYPGLYAIFTNRIAHELHLLHVPLIPRMMTEYAHSLTGIDIHPGATIGKYFFIDHGTGVVVGETTQIGNNVKLYQGVTLGALSTRGGQVLRNVKRHPTLEDNVTVYSGASILGGNTVIGTGAVIGSNAFITASVPPHTRVSIKNPELQFKDRSNVRTAELGQEGFFNRKEID